MKNSILSFTLVAGLLVAGGSQANPLPAELLMGNGRSWRGQLVSRNGDWIEFKTVASAKPIRVGAGTIKELKFNVEIDADKISEMMRNRQFERVINTLSRSIEPFSEYSDIPSNLTRYNALLMELYYRTKQYDESLALSGKIAKDDRNLRLQSKARTYQALSLIESGKSDEVKTLFVEYGWTKETSKDASPEELYIKAKLLVLDKQYSEAIELVSLIVAFKSQDPDWMQPAEMLCAEIYTELGMYDSAEEVCREILILYKNTPEFDKAKKLKIKIEKLRAEKQVEESLTSEEV